MSYRSHVQHELQQQLRTLKKEMIDAGIPRGWAFEIFLSEAREIVESWPGVQDSDSAGPEMLAAFDYIARLLHDGKYASREYVARERSWVRRAMRVLSGISATKSYFLKALAR